MTETELSIDEYLARLRELEARNPVPTWDDVMAEWEWVRSRMADGTLDPDHSLTDRHIAVFDRRVVGVDTNPLRLRYEKAVELGIHPERLIITYIF